MDANAAGRGVFADADGAGYEDGNLVVGVRACDEGKESVGQRFQRRVVESL